MVNKVHIQMCSYSEVNSDAHSGQSKVHVICFVCRTFKTDSSTILIEIDGTLALYMIQSTLKSLTGQAFLRLHLCHSMLCIEGMLLQALLGGGRLHQTNHGW